MALAARKGKPLTRVALSTLRDLIRAGFDPLGEAFCILRSPEDRRADGATYARCIQPIRSLLPRMSWNGHCIRLMLYASPVLHRGGVQRATPA
jgi:hypothetical protein